MVHAVIRMAVLLVVAAGTSCTSQNGIFSSKKSPREMYATKIKDAGLHLTHLGGAWNTAGERSLQQPAGIRLPYLETGYFARDNPQAAGYSFSLRRGEQVNIQVTALPASGLLLFAELWQPRAGQDMKLLATADTISRSISYEANEDGSYILRIQPELLKNVEYTVKITTAPSLAFPVRASDNPRITSLWGAARDGGVRSHEGIDISGARGTPLVATADGRITRTGENNLGGKVVFLRPGGKDYSVYYAHLDSQLVRPGQEVKTGDVIGLMGNTGNARTTAPHLHFGIYTSSGAVDPLPFIEQARKGPAPVTAAISNLDAYLRTRIATSIYREPFANAPVVLKAEAAHPVKIIAATANWYKVMLPSGEPGFITAASVATGAWKKQTLRADTRLLEAPAAEAPAIFMVPANTEIAVIGKQDNYLLVTYKEMTGWIKEYRTDEQGIKNNEVRTP